MCCINQMTHNIYEIMQEVSAKYIYMCLESASEMEQVWPDKQYACKLWLCVKCL